jgi:hypothetical protein
VDLRIIFLYVFAGQENTKKMIPTTLSARCHEFTFLVQLSPFAANITIEAEIA